MLMLALKHWTAVYLLNVAVRSELAKGNKGPHLLDTESRGQESPHP